MRRRREFRLGSVRRWRAGRRVRHRGGDRCTLMRRLHELDVVIIKLREGIIFLWPEFVLALRVWWAIIRCQNGLGRVERWWRRTRYKMAFGNLSVTDLRGGGSVRDWARRGLQWWNVRNGSIPSLLQAFDALFEKRPGKAQVVKVESQSMIQYLIAFNMTMSLVWSPSW